MTVEQPGDDERLSGPIKASFRFEYWALRSVDWLLGRMSVDRASALMGWIWRTVAPHLHRHPRAEANLTLAMPHLSAKERRSILLDSWENLGRTAAEALRIEEIAADRSRFTLSLEPIRHLMAKSHEGAVFASLHQGNWELAGFGIRAAGWNVAGVYRPLKNPLTEAFVLSRRRGVYNAGLFGRERSSALRLRTIARQGAAIGMLADLRDPGGIHVDFFGAPAPVTTYPAVLARRLKLPLIAGRVIRAEGVRFRVEAVEIEVPFTDDVDADIVAATHALHRQYEAWIRSEPRQWMWAHRKGI
ncbi:lysophospholipid acyltransferase family protein [Chthonobacter albigriseus]|uniref:lysophospholipid acyltransferase family protein n=1 Tax=Chthonobacter albigriseus TaxID=1683161 RepID=UPI0015EFC382|nr:lauroyl acyltransferase [Chthonobacter albigriseus]